MAAAFVLGEVCAAGIDRTWKKNQAEAVWLFAAMISMGLLVSFITILMEKKKEQRRRWLGRWVLLTVCLTAGGFRYQQAESKQLDAEIFDMQVEIRGKIDWLQETAYGRRMLLSQVKIRGVEQKDLQLCAYISSQEELYPGDRVLLSGMLEELEHARNPGEFDSYAYYHSLGCQYAFRVTELKAVRTPTVPVYRVLMRIRERLQEVFREICTPDASGIYQAMLLGEKTELLEETKELYSANGISHILAISGLHIAVLGMGLYRLCRKVGGFSSSGLAAGLLIQLYVMMTGSAVSAERACIMFVIQLFSHVCKRSYDMLSAAAAALLVLLWKNPYYICNSGFQLSFGAVFAIGAVYPVLVKTFKMEKTKGKSLLSGAAVSLVTFPILAWSFYVISPYSLILNLFVIPCMTFVMISGLLGVVTGLFYPMAGKFFVALGQGILLGYEWMCRLIGGLPGSTVVTGRPNQEILLLYYLLLTGGILLLRKRMQYEQKKRHPKSVHPDRWVVCMAMILLPMLLLIHGKREFVVWFLDVSQGDGIYIETPERLRILIDGGSSDEKKLYQYTLLPFLQYQGVSSLDFVVVTHPDEDHISGIKELLQKHEVYVGTLLLPDIQEEWQDEAYQELITLAREQGVEVDMISRGDRLQQGQLALTCLYPYKGIHPQDRNSYSVVLDIRYGNSSMLFTGDIEEEGETYLVREGLQNAAGYDVLKVAHHGSRNSTTESFLERVNPRIAVISCGEGNFYGHPHQETLERLEQVGSRIYVTAESGAVCVRMDEKGKRGRITVFCPNH